MADMSFCRMDFLNITKMSELVETQYSRNAKNPEQFQSCLWSVHNDAFPVTRSL